MAARPKSKPNTKFLSAWIDVEVLKAVKAEAIANDRTVAGEVNFRLKQSLKRNSKRRTTMQAAE